ncbi:CDP-glycerol:poly(glycerophosphate) glycerophosphotransferase [Neobacillus bataviensis]|uniref:CDP-glycerol:poly(Glycerophosphate) glycerophosphotransferase n=1 Tax=Neobacillus bataviensis TaxID=220685 RepID=A0A561CMC7_9BACI|nr:CDP-glycerol glycerophosphotransferase family protein [Neobacillus bataviensis]TWD92401.1 CDP-glycerol:poly(glycerophosphate) glycerophosphotransferase [Neobacillus bataviensis]
MRCIQLLDLDFNNGVLTGILTNNTEVFHENRLTFFLYSKELKTVKSVLAHITKVTKQQIHFKFPLQFDFLTPNDNSVGTLDLYVTLADNQKYRLIIRSTHLYNKITYSPFYYQMNNQIAFFTLKKRKLAIVYGNTTNPLQNMKRDKVIISDISFNVLEKTLSFKVNGPINQHLSGVVLVDRSSKTEWVERIQPTDNGIIHIHLTHFSNTYYDQFSRWDVFLETVNFSGEQERSKLGQFDKPSAPKFKRYFHSSPTKGVNAITPYLTEQNGLSLVISEPRQIASEKLNTKLKVTNFTMKRNIIEGKVYVQFPELSSFHVKSLVLKYRNQTEHIEYGFPILENKRSQSDCVAIFSIDIAKLELQNFYWDFYLLVDANNEDCLIRLKNPTGIVRRHINKQSEIQSYTYDNGYWVHPYMTASNTIALLYKVKEEYETSWYYFKEKLAYFLYLSFKWYFDQKNIWLGFEKFSDSAQDNGFYFFQYCYQQRKHKNFYYVIKNESPDYDNLQAMSDKVVHYMSFKYMVYVFAASLLISSESKGHLYDLRVQKGLLKKAIDRKRQVFLQHGVIGLKRVNQIFKKTGKGAVDLFVVSSEHEKGIIKKNFGYKEEEIILTGLSRWDVLTDQSNGQPTILVMPTWRSWMDGLPEDKFIKTEYYKQYVSILNSRLMEDTVERYAIQLNFFIHPKFKTYIDKFTSHHPRIKIYQFGDIKLNELLMHSSLLITDYSSVSWDMYYQKKPIIFFQFDLEDYLKFQGSYIDMEKDLFGDRAQNVGQLISLITMYAERDFKEKKKFASMRKQYLKYTDHQNSQRIYQEILNHKKQLVNKKRGLGLYNSSLLRTLWAYSKKNDLFFNMANYIKRLLIKS